jgi:hypothetical protein
MKLSNITFPHPVLGVYRTGNPDSEANDIQGRFEVETTIVQADALCIQNKFKLKQAKDIERLMNEGNLAFACELTCAKTFFRKIYLCEADEQKIRIEFDDLREIVSFDFFVICKKSFTYKYSKMWHDDYRDLSFPIEPGMPIAYGGGLQYMVERVSSDTGSTTSLIQIKSHDKESIAIDYNDGPITVFIPIELFPTLQATAQTRRYDSTLHASIVVPVLMAAMPYLARREGIYEDQRWFQCLKTKLENDVDLQRLDPEADSFEIAQRILKLPFTALIRTIRGEIDVVD